MTGTRTEGARPTLRVISGNPTPEEIAAILAVVACAAASTAADAPGAAGSSDRWAGRERLMPQHWAPGPGAWRTSMLPR